MSAVKKNFKLDAGASLRFSFRFKDTQGIPIPMENYTAKGSITNCDRSVTYTSFAITLSQDFTTFTCFLSAAESLKLNSIKESEVRYDIFITSPDSFRTKVMKGDIAITKSSTVI